MDISEANMEEHSYFSTVKKGKSSSSILDQKRAEAVRTLQIGCAFPSNKEVVDAPECNSIEGIDFGCRNMKIGNEIYGHSKGAAMGKFNTRVKESR